MLRQEVRGDPGVDTCYRGREWHAKCRDSILTVHSFFTNQNLAVNVEATELIFSFRCLVFPVEIQKDNGEVMSS